ncbi:DUF6518 family protein [Klenkia sp. LSe6-5]|uniref:DUF6518 family protein n=1 Tax=Klenkia sesuvii TaxID=3103137 RepID=A0ABU8DWM8_9ACTN
MDRTADQLSTTASPRLLLAAMAGGLLTGGFAAWAYYGDAFRELSHTFGLWILLVVLVSARRPWRAAVAASVVALATAVVAFYVGKDVMYGVEYPGMPYEVNTSVLVEWLVLAVVAGTVLGWGASHVGQPGRWGPVATAGAVGLLVADAARRAAWYAPDPAVLVLAAAAVLVVLRIGARTPGQLTRTAAWVLPSTVAGFLLVSAPDVLEQLLATGSPW